MRRPCWDPRSDHTFCTHLHGSHWLDASPTAKVSFKEDGKLKFIAGWQSTMLKYMDSLKKESGPYFAKKIDAIIWKVFLFSPSALPRCLQLYSSHCLLFFQWMASSLIPSQPLFLFTRFQSLRSLQDFAPHHPSLSYTIQVPFSTRSFPSADKCAVITLILKANPRLTLCSLQLCPVSSHPAFSPLCPLGLLQPRFISITPLKLHLFKSPMISFLA